MAKRNILIAIDFPPQVGGISHYLSELVESLPSNCIEVIGINEAKSNEYDLSVKYQISRISIPDFLINKRWYLYCLTPIYLIKLFQKKAVQQVLCGQAHLSLLMAAWFFSKIRRIPFGVFTYGLDVLNPQTRIYKSMYNFLLKQANFIISISNATKEIVEKIGVTSKNIFIIPPSIDPEKFVLKELPYSVLRKENYFSKKILLSIGRLIDRKGFDTVINILPEVVKLIPEVHYFIVGIGPAESKLKDLVKTLNLQNSVTFAGYISDEELPHCYHEADIFIMVSREIKEKGDIEGFGIVYLEAGLMEKPVIAGESGGVVDAVVHEETGLLVNPNNPDELKDAIIQLLSNPELSQYYGSSGKKFVLSNFTTQKIGKQFQALILS